MRGAGRVSLLLLLLLLSTGHVSSFRPLSVRPWRDPSDRRQEAGRGVNRLVADESSFPSASVAWALREKETGSEVSSKTDEAEGERGSGGEGKEGLEEENSRKGVKVEDVELAREREEVERALGKRQTGAGGEGEAYSPRDDKHKSALYRYNKGRLLDSLIHGYPHLFDVAPDLSLYTPDVIFEDPSGWELKGHETYKKIWEGLHLVRRSVDWYEIRHTVVWDPYMGCARVSWHLSLKAPGIDGLVYADGISLYFLNDKGLCWKHQVSLLNVMPPWLMSVLRVARWVDLLNDFRKGRLRVPVGTVGVGGRASPLPPAALIEVLRLGLALSSSLSRSRSGSRSGLVLGQAGDPGLALSVSGPGFLSVGGLDSSLGALLGPEGVSEEAGVREEGRERGDHFVVLGGSVGSFSGREKESVTETETAVSSSWRRESGREGKHEQDVLSDGLAQMELGRRKEEENVDEFMLFLREGGGMGSVLLQSPLHIPPSRWLSSGWDSRGREGVDRGEGEMVRKAAVGPGREYEEESVVGPNGAFSFSSYEQEGSALRPQRGPSQHKQRQRLDLKKRRGKLEGGMPGPLLAKPLTAIFLLGAANFPM
uniref:SnoaL-like domain-containing protein n=1 Tax=Chromera velia CCMP2878 TaxID=1169474 RepID=A0A0G4HF53_9ALVE|eukprot:Cvel_26943.t1-p1 / transcript=Cvel_26943.t1 / gene=Cvel_26943 / organism=Chromera_velia_CCMP2878 / gene_product=hypothetical protein / transcript_product=hypothetical protein / location=Cvel_scaffold3282:3516-8071(-) / protein_length=595 / sequence_SO=supercontig / SO=protein_coding / is_pseudo=false